MSKSAMVFAGFYLFFFTEKVLRVLLKQRKGVSGTDVITRWKENVHAMNMLLHNVLTLTFTLDSFILKLENKEQKVLNLQRSRCIFKIPKYEDSVFNHSVLVLYV